MGNISNTEKFFIVILGIILSPFIFVRDFILKPIGRIFGFFPEQTYEITPEQQAANEALAAAEMEKLNKQD